MSFECKITKHILLNFCDIFLFLNPVGPIEYAATTWWRHQMETFSALLAICAGNSQVAGEFPTQRPVTRSFDVFFDLRLNKRLSKQSLGWWLETISRPLWRHRNQSILSDYTERCFTLLHDAPNCGRNLVHLEYIPYNMHTFLVLCFFMIIYPKTFGLKWPNYGCTDSAKLVSPQSSTDEKVGGPVKNMGGPIKLLYITMFKIGKSCKKLIFGPVKHEKF